MLESFVWVNEPGFKDHGLDGWRCIGGSPNVRLGGTSRPSTNTFGKEIGSYKTFIRRGSQTSGDYWDVADESFIKTQNSQSFYSADQKFRFRILPIEAADRKFTFYDDSGSAVVFNDVRQRTQADFPSMYTVYAGVLTRADLTTKIGLYGKTLDDIGWNSWNRDLIVDGKNIGNTVRTDYFKNWLLNKYNGMGREAFDEWAMKQMYETPVSERANSSDRTGVNPYQRELDLIDSPVNIRQQLVDMLNNSRFLLNQSGSWLPNNRNDYAYMDLVENGTYRLQVGHFSQMVRDSGLGSFGSMRSIQTSQTLNNFLKLGFRGRVPYGIASVIYSNDFLRAYNGPGSTSIADNFLGKPLKWPAEDAKFSGTLSKTDPARDQFWNVMAGRLVDSFLEDASATQFDGTVSPQHGYVFEIVNDSLPWNLSPSTNTYIDSKDAGQYLMYRETYRPGTGPLQSFYNGGVSYAKMVEDTFNTAKALSNPGVSTTIHPYFSDLVGITHWKDWKTESDDVGQIPSFQLRWDSSQASPEPQELPTSRV